MWNKKIDDNIAKEIIGWVGGLSLYAVILAGIIVYINQGHTVQASTYVEQPAVSQQGGNIQKDEQNLGAPSTTVPEEENDNNEQTTTQTGNAGNTGVTGTTNNTGIRYEEFTTERIEEIEKQISESLQMSWKPLNINPSYNVSNLGIYKPQLSIAKASATVYGNTAVTKGEPIVYVIQVRNDGEEDVTGINISDIIPAQTTLMEGTISGDGALNKTNKKISWKVNVKAGEIATVRFAARVNDNAKGTIDNIAIIDGTETNKTQNTVIETSKTAEVYKDNKWEENKPANIGDKIKYTVTIENTGNVDTVVNVKDTIPENTKLVSDIVIKNEVIDEETLENGKDVTIPAKGTTTLNFTVEVTKPAETIGSTATVDGTKPSAEVKIAHLEIAKTVSQTGEEGTYTENVTLTTNETAYFKIELQNTGSEPLELNVTDIINGQKIDVYEEGKKLTKTIKLEPKETKILTATYTMTQADIDNQEILTNTITATEIDGKVPNLEDTATITPEVPAPSLAIEKKTTAVTVKGTKTEKGITENTKVRPGDTITYTISVKNTGNITLQNVNITDSLDVKYKGRLIEASKAEAIEKIKSLAPNEEKTFTVKYEVTQEDLEKELPITNTATATAGTTTATTETDKQIPINPDITLSGTKTWHDYENQEKTRPDSITIEILNGIKVVDTIKVKASDDWKYTSKALPKYDEKGQEIEYQVKEKAITGYTTKIEGTDIVNTLATVPTRTVSGTKTWYDYENQEKTRPDSITIEVLYGDTVVDTIEVKAADGWKYTSKALTKYDENNKEIEYTVREKAVAGYTTEVKGFDIENTLATIPTKTISGTKTWYDYENQEKTRPDSITIEVLYGDKVVDTIEVKASDDWKYTSKALTKYDENNKEIEYTVREKAVAGYTTEVKGFDIENTLATEPTKTISGTKTWYDYENQEKTRPDSITIEVLNGGKVVDTIEVKAADGWKYTSKPLQKYGEDNQEIEYEIREKEVKDYNTAIKDFDIINTLATVPTKTVSGTKTWKDYDNQEGTRPDSITIEVLNGDKVVETIEVKAEDGWKYTSKPLTKYDENNKEIEYEVREKKVEGYRTKVEGTDIINTLAAIPTKTISGEKIWHDYNNQEKTRPDSITIEILQGDKVVDTIEVKASNDWKYTSKALPKYDAKNKEIEYEVREKKVDGYNTEIKDFDIINTLATVPTKTISGTKTWYDYENQEKTRPDSITIEVLNGDKVVETIDVKAADGWKYTSKPLQKYGEDNKEIEYEIREKEVKGYNTEIKDFDIINTLATVPTISLTGTLVWDDVDNADGIRPDNVIISVASSDSTDTVARNKTIGKQQNGSYVWNYEFKDLPKYDDNNQLINYTVSQLGIDKDKYTITVEPTQKDATTGNITANITSKHEPAPKLTKVKKTSAGTTVKPNEVITYTLETENIGKVDAESVVITDIVPDYTTLNAGSISNDGVLGQDGKTITWNVGDLAIGEKATVTFSVTVDATAEAIGKTIVNVGKINGEETNSVGSKVVQYVTTSKVIYPIQNVDIVLVLDVSGSMNDNNRMTNMKNAAKDFISGIFPDGATNTGSTVTVIKFSDTASIVGTKATNYRTAETLKTQVGSLTATGGTNVQAALSLANTVVDGLSNTNKFVLFLGDGAPTPNFVIVEGNWGGETYTTSDSVYGNNTEAKITAQATALKGKTTGVYSIGFGVSSLLDEREYWSHYIECKTTNCKDSKHIVVTGNTNKGKTYHWESARSYATRVLRDIIADAPVAATATSRAKTYYYEATDTNASSIISQFMTVLEEISIEVGTSTANSGTIKIEVPKQIDKTKEIKIMIDDETIECLISELPQVGLTFTETEEEAYFTWDLAEHPTAVLRLEYTVNLLQ